MNPNQIIGRGITEFRAARGLSQLALVEELNRHGLSWFQTTLSRAERGTRAIQLAEAPALAAALEVTIEDLIGSIYV